MLNVAASAKARRCVFEWCAIFSCANIPITVFSWVFLEYDQPSFGSKKSPLSADQCSQQLKWFQQARRQASACCSRWPAKNTLMNMPLSNSIDVQANHVCSFPWCRHGGELLSISMHRCCAVFWEYLILKLSPSLVKCSFLQTCRRSAASHR